MASILTTYISEYVDKVLAYIFRHFTVNDNPVKMDKSKVMTRLTSDEVNYSIEGTNLKEAIAIVVFDRIIQVCADQFTQSQERQVKAGIKALNKDMVDAETVHKEPSPLSSKSSKSRPGSGSSVETEAPLGIIQCQYIYPKGQGKNIRQCPKQLSRASGQLFCTDHLKTNTGQNALRRIRAEQARAGVQDARAKDPILPDAKSLMRESTEIDINGEVRYSWKSIVYGIGDDGALTFYGTLNSADKFEKKIAGNICEFIRAKHWSISDDVICQNSVTVTQLDPEDISDDE